jgi:very-short-patch-repair endonuclease
VAETTAADGAESFYVGMRSLQTPKSYVEAERACVDLAFRQHGVLARAQAIAIGMPQHALRWRVDSGHWRRPLPRVYAPGRHPLTFRGRAMTAHLWAADGSLIAGRAAAALHAFPRFEQSDIEVLTTRRLSHPDVLVHTRAEIPPIARTTVDGIPVTSIPWTLLDLSAGVGQDLVEDALDFCIASGKASIPYLSRFVARYGGKGHRGVGALRKLLSTRSEHHSPHTLFERRLLRLIAAARLTAPVSQFIVHVPSGERFRLDFAYSDEKVAIEADSIGWHFGVSAWHRDRARATLLAAAGWTVLRFTWHDLVNRPEWTVDCVRTALHGRGQLSL